MTQIDMASCNIQLGRAEATATSLGQHHEDDRSTKTLPSPDHQCRKGMAKRLHATAIRSPGILAGTMAPADYSHSSPTSGSITRSKTRPSRQAWRDKPRVVLHSCNRSPQNTQFRLLSCTSYHKAGFAQLWNRQTFAATTTWFSENRRLLIPWYRRNSLTGFFIA